ncbi:hypothetical protein ABZP36_025930 [Zizania latifolia]
MAAIWRRRLDRSDLSWCDVLLRQAVQAWPEDWRSAVGARRGGVQQPVWQPQAAVAMQVALGAFLAVRARQLRASRMGKSGEEAAAVPSSSSSAAPA